MQRNQPPQENREKTVRTIKLSGKTGKYSVAQIQEAVEAVLSKPGPRKKAPLDAAPQLRPSAGF